MRALGRLGVVLCAFAIACLPSRAAETILRIGADEWMPFNGVATDDRPGYVVDLARAVFQAKGINVEYQVMPWEDALAAVRAGRMGAVIGANKAEAAGMIIPEESVGSPPVCLMTRSDSPWTYNNLVSFRSVQLGVIKDYSYWPHLDGYIEKKAGSGVVVVQGETPLDDLMQLLMDRKVEVIAETEPVLLWHLRANNLDRSLFRVVYKHEAEPIYLAFAPGEDGRRFAAVFDAGVKELRASGELDRLLRRYGLRDWQQESVEGEEVGKGKVGRLKPDEVRH